MWTANKVGPPEWGLGKRIMTHHKKPACYGMLHNALVLDRLFQTTYGMENGHKILDLREIGWEGVD
jgi:hypothetical protein